MSTGLGLLGIHLPGMLVWGGDQLGWETHTRGKDSFGPHYSHSLAILLHFSLSLELYPSMNRQSQKQPWAFKGLKGSCSSGGIFPSSLLPLPSSSGLEGQLERKTVQHSVPTETL
jgi:hypothetical protein